MPSSFAKNYWIHRCLGCLAACAIASSYLLLTKKLCQIPVLSHEDIQSAPIRALSADQIKLFSIHYYDLLHIYHYIAFGWCVLVFLLAFINVVPQHQDLKILVICLLILLMASMALFTLYIAFYAFHKPCRSPSATNREPEYKLESRSPKDLRPVNVYEDEDDQILHVCLIDASVAFVLLCSAFLYFFDSRQVFIEWRN